ncbi:substrate-binding domain-containing protein [Iodidimonas sp. SYSU 1G8]|uniref:substrate-binding domain-containing protein n=1 Tax=Iodidimonas sp. SYSU 1G8 TaxID=3133967 RepID=UPI0031FE9908
MFNKTLIGLATVAVVSAAASGAAFARDQIQVAGSSTVLPFATVVAEQFGKQGKYKSPVVESGGSSAGLKKFCEGVGPNYIDVANSSRAIKTSEVEACNKAGVTGIMEVKFGYDGIVFATPVGKTAMAFTPKDIYLALASQVPVKGKLVANPNKTWKDVNPSFPDAPIMAFIPGEKHGTREVFEEKVLTVGCEEFPEIAKLDKDAKKKACNHVRKDGLAVDIDGDYTETLARLKSNPDGVGVFGLSFYDQNRDKIQVSTVNGVTPSMDTIGSGEYPVSRPLFFYVKKAHLAAIPGLKQYAEFFLSEDMIGDDGMLIEKGLIPAPASQREQFRATWKAGKTVD